MKRRIPFMIAMFIVALGLIACSSQENITDDSYVISDEPLHEPPDATAQPEPENDIVPEVDPLDEAIKAAIVEQNKGKYLPGECYGVGYKNIEIIPCTLLDHHGLKLELNNNTTLRKPRKSCK